MAMSVSPDVAKLFQVLTGEEWPDADEDQLRALAGEWAAAAQDLRDLAVGLSRAVDSIGTTFEGAAARAFLERIAPFVQGDNLIATAAELFQGLADYLLDLALDVEYMKLVIIYSLIALIAEIALAIALSPFTGGSSMTWLAARFAIVRFLIRSLLGRVLLQVLQAAVFGIAFQLLIDAAAQLTQYGMGTRDEWNTDHTANAAGVGAMGAALALPIAGLGKLAGKGLNNLLDAALAKRFGKNWAQKTTKELAEIASEAFHETMTEALYVYATTGKFEMNPYSTTSGAISAGGHTVGEGIGNKLFPKSGTGSQSSNDQTTRGPANTAGNDIVGNGPGGQVGNGPVGNGPAGNGPLGNGPVSGGPSGNGPVGGTGDTGPAGDGSTGNGPVGNGPMGDGPVGNGPVGSGPAGNGPVGSGPVGDGSVGNGPVGNGPAGSGPVGGGPVGNGPVSNGPVGSGPVGSGPVGNGPVSNGPVGSGPVGSGPVGNGPVSNGPVGSGPVGSGPVVNGPVGNEPVGSGPAGNGPVVSGPVGDGPIGNGPVENGPVGNGPIGRELNGPVGSGPLGNGPVVNGIGGDGPLGNGPIGSAPVGGTDVLAGGPLANTTPSDTVPQPTNPTSPSTSSPEGSHGGANTPSNEQTVAPQQPNDLPEDRTGTARPTDPEANPTIPGTTAGHLSETTTGTTHDNSTLPPLGTDSNSGVKPVDPTGATVGKPAPEAVADNTSQPQTTPTDQPPTAPVMPQQQPTAKDNPTTQQSPSTPTTQQTTSQSSSSNTTTLPLTPKPGSSSRSTKPVTTPMTQVPGMAPAETQEAAVGVEGAIELTTLAPPPSSPHTSQVDPHGNETATGHQAENTAPEETRVENPQERNPGQQENASHGESRGQDTAEESPQSTGQEEEARHEGARGREESQGQNTGHEEPLEQETGHDESQGQSSLGDQSQPIGRDEVLGQRSLGDQSQPTGRDDPQGQSGSDVQSRRTNQEESRGQSSPHDQSQHTGQDESQQRDNGRDDTPDDEHHDTPDPLPQLIATIEQAARDVSAARDRAAALLPLADYAGAEARAHRDAAQPHVRVALGAKVATEAISGPAGARVTQARNQVNSLSSRPNDDPELVRARQALDFAVLAQASADSAAKAYDDAVAAVKSADDAVDAVDVARGDIDSEVSAIDRAAADIQTALDQARGGRIPVDITQHLDAVRDAEARAVEARGKAKSAVDDAKKAKDAAKDAAKQGEYDRGLTYLSFTPPGMPIRIESLGSRDGLIDAVTQLTGAPRRDIAAQINALSTDQFAAAVNDGHLTVDTPGGPVRLGLSEDLNRPADTRTAPRHTGPATVKSETSGEKSVPVSESTSSSVPIRVPLLFISPTDLAGAAVRPTVYIGVTGKWGQKFETTQTTSTTSSSERNTYVPTTMSVTFSLPNGDTRTGSVDVGVRTPDITRTAPTVVDVPDGAHDKLSTGPAVLPPSIRDFLGNTPNVGDNFRTHLLGDGPSTTTINGRNVVISPAQPPTITLLGTTSTDNAHGVSVGNSGQSTSGSEAVFGAGVYAGLKGWFAGAFLDLSSGTSDGSTPSTEDSITKTTSDTELVYRVDRPVRVEPVGGPRGNGVQDTVYGLVTLTPQEARDLGLPLPPHLDGQAAVSLPENDTRASQRRYFAGRDDIKSVNSTGISDFITTQLGGPDGTRLGGDGRANVESMFSSDSESTKTVYDMLNGGAQVVWHQDGATHFADVFAYIPPPSHTRPSGQTSTTTEVKHTDKFGRGISNNRTVRFGVGGAYTPVGKDNPNTDAPKTTPQAGNPNPAQGGPTSSAGAPRVSAGVTWETGTSGKSSYAGKDGRAAKFEGDMRDYDGPLDIVVVHRSTKDPNWAQKFFLGDRMLFGPKAADRMTGPSWSDVDTVMSGGRADNIHTGRVDDAIRMTTPADKIDWATKPLPPGDMQAAVYVGTPPAAPRVAINPQLFGDYATAEHVSSTPNVLRGVDLATAKRITMNDGSTETVVRKPPALSGTYPSYAQSTFTETRTDGDGTHITQYTYKQFDLTRPGTAPGKAVRDFIGRVGAQGLVGQGFDGRPNSTGTMVKEGLVTDLNGKVDGKATYYSPRVVKVRPNGTLKRNQAGDQTAGSSSSWSIGGDVGVILNVTPRRTNGVGGPIGAEIGGGGKYGRSDGRDTTIGAKQVFEYKGPTAFIALDTRYHFSAEMSLGNIFARGSFGDAPVTVDQPDGVLVEMPVKHAADMFTALGLEVPPELAAAVPTKDQTTGGAHTLLPGPGEYASYSDTSVVDARLDGDGWKTDVGTRLDDIKVTDPKWRQEILDQIDIALNSPSGHVWLRDALAGDQGKGGLLSIPHPNPRFSDTVDIRVSADRAGRDASNRPATALTPNKLTNSSYVSTAHQPKKTTAGSVAAAINAGVSRSENPSIPPGKPGPDGVIRQSPPNDGASNGSLLLRFLGGGKSWKTDVIEDGKGNPGSSRKQTTQVDNDKVGRDTRPTDFTLEITRRRGPMPAVDTLLLGAPKHADWDILPKGTASVPIAGEVDLVSPLGDVIPPLTKPERAPEFEVVPRVPDLPPPLFTPDDGARIVAIGSDTVNSIHDGTYAQFSTKRLPPGAKSTEDISTAAKSTSEYTKPGTQSEYILHNTTKGTSVHNASNVIFSGGIETGRILGTKHPLYDSLFDHRLVGDIRPGDLAFVRPVPEDATMNLNQDADNSTSTGTTKTVTNTFNPGLTGSGANTHTAAGPAPTSVGTGPAATEGVSSDTVDATAAKTSGVTGGKHSGRSYLFTPNVATIYSEAHRYGSNFTHKPINAVKDTVFGRSHPTGSVLKITSHRDMLIQVWENTALDKGLITIADVWHHAGKLATNVSRDGTIHPPGQPPQHPSDPAGGRNLHVAPGVTVAEVSAFVGTLPKDMRPSTYTVADGTPFTADDILTAVRDLPEPVKATSEDQTDTQVDETATPEIVVDPPAEANTDVVEPATEDSPEEGNAQTVLPPEAGEVAPERTTEATEHVAAPPAEVRDSGGERVVPVEEVEAPIQQPVSVVDEPSVEVRETGGDQVAPVEVSGQQDEVETAAPPNARGGEQAAPVGGVELPGQQDGVVSAAPPDVRGTDGEQAAPVDGVEVPGQQDGSVIAAPALEVRESGGEQVAPVDEVEQVGSSQPPVGLTEGVRAPEESGDGGRVGSVGGVESSARQGGPGQPKVVPAARKDGAKDGPETSIEPQTEDSVGDGSSEQVGEVAPAQQLDETENATGQEAVEGGASPAAAARVEPPGSGPVRRASAPAVLTSGDGRGPTDSLGAPWQPGQGGSQDVPMTGFSPGPSSPNKRSRDSFEGEDGPVTGPEPKAMRPVPEALVPPADADVRRLTDVVQPGTRFADPATFAPLINGQRSQLGRDVNCVDSALAFHSTWSGVPRVAGSAVGGAPRGAATRAAEELGYPPELVGWGAGGLGEVIDRVGRAGHGADALVFGFPRQGQGHAWNVVNHNGQVLLVDPQAGTVAVAHANAVPGLDRVYAIPLSAAGEFIEHHAERDVDLSEFIDMDMVDLRPQATLTMAQAHDLYRILKAATFQHSTAGELPIPWQHPEDGCYIRAHLWAQQLRAWGIDVRKIFVGRGDNGLLAFSSNALGATRDNPRPVFWAYHVAPLVTVSLGGPDNGTIDVVLDPAMGQGVVPVRTWLALGGVVDGFRPEDEHLVRPAPAGYEGPLGADETRVLVTDDHALFPPWVDAARPATFDQATDLMRDWEDTIRQFSVEETARSAFRAWHENLPSDARNMFDFISSTLDTNGVRDFQDLFRSLSRGERDAAARALSAGVSDLSQLSPDWTNRVTEARSHLGSVDPLFSQLAKDAATWIVQADNDFLLGDGDLMAQTVDVVAHRYDTEGEDSATALAKRLFHDRGAAIDLSGILLDPDWDWTAPAEDPAPHDGAFDFDAFFDFDAATHQRGTPPTDSVGGPTYVPPEVPPVPDHPRPPAPADTAALLAAVPPGTRFADPTTFVHLINGHADANRVDAALAFHATYRGDPRVAGTGGSETTHAPELIGSGPDAVTEVIDRVTRAGHGADALLIGFPRRGRGGVWNVVNHNGVVLIVNAQLGTVAPATPTALPDLARVYAIPLDANDQFITTDTPPTPPTDADPYTLAEYDRAMEAHRLRTAAASGEEIPVPGGTLVPSLGGLRMVGAAITAELAASLAALTGRDILAYVIGADAEPDAERDERRPVWPLLRFPPRGRPEPVPDPAAA